MVFLFIGLLAGMPPAALGQEHHCGWLRATAEVPLGKKWRTDAELQERRQSSIGTTNPLAAQQMYSWRQWLYYTHSSSFRLALSPIAYFHSRPYIITAADEHKPATEEYRFTAAAEWQQPLPVRHLFVTARVGAEYRLVQHNPAMLRTRYRAGIRYAITPKYTAGVNYEYLIGTTTRPAFTDFDNARAWASITHPLTPHLRAELGFLHIDRKLKNGDLMQENNILLNLFFGLGKDAR